MLLKNEDSITVEAYDEEEIRKLKRKGFVNIFEDIAKKAAKKKARKVLRSTKGTKARRSSS